MFAVTKSVVQRQLARRLGFAMLMHRDWQLSYLGLAILSYNLGLDGPIVMGRDEE